MAQNLTSKFEDLAKGPPPSHSVQLVDTEIQSKNWSHSGNTGGGHSGHDGKYTNVTVVSKEKTVFDKPPPPKKSFADLP